MIANGFTYGAGRNDGWEHTDNVRKTGVPVGSTDSVPGGQTYLEGFQDGVELRNSGYHADGSKMQ